MPQGTFTNAWISETAKILFRGSPAPDATKFYVGLADTDALTRASTIASFVAKELVPESNYTRANLTLSGDGSYNSAANRHELPTATITFTAGDTSWQFQTAFLIANAHQTCSVAFTNSNVNAATDRIAIASHPWIAGDRLVFTADELATLPTGIDAGTIYQVLSPTTNDFQIATLGSSTPVNIQNTGAGTFRARSANGIVSVFAVEPSPITLLPGRSYAYQIPIALLNTGFVSGN
ncbi:hypothetical protein VF14_03625 [Nostoc linckia z18]|jgi:hypothetical protein|uniref:Uncharacterized protein n=2 Tax=Nostoc linckia TaxID=92942 RepID=A0A9Q5ZGL7_NOSLI|nr:hypothetical protein [Nostoc linckia]PHK41464.1 hypothetical protein VF12_06610 [Nostoc linckia z15]PHK46965.1 hypothetical protein VF13_08270 [Nostoc linckia z16]PHJ69226.1 hypothetical protein VF02_01095 [Nostoc linckia z1]PHJ73378.1 hypothetical protein VF05_02115 [Nostoc linckia z3]PHJ78725.1 hypothetical protein VF03_01100 [Nostoc linckia z2]